MPEINDELSDSLSIEESITMEITSYLPIFGSVASADRYFSERLDTQLWEVASLENKQKALVQATRAIDQLRFAGYKNDATQPLEWPRNDEETIPEGIQQATYEEAFNLLKGADIDTESNSLFVSSRVFGKVRTDYDFRTAPEHIVAGITSFKAWRFLQPFLDPARGINLRRRS
jgi:hypothetical protein